MYDEHEMKEKILQDLIDEMRNSDGGKLKPKAVEVSVSSMRPEMGKEENPDLGPMGETEMPMGDHKEPDGDELSPEDMSLLENLLGGEKDDEERE